MAITCVYAFLHQLHWPVQATAGIRLSRPACFKPKSPQLGPQAAIYDRCPVSPGSSCAAPRHHYRRLSSALEPDRPVCGNHSTIDFVDIPASAPSYSSVFLFAANGYNAPVNTTPEHSHWMPSPGSSITALAGWLLLTFSASATSVFVATDGWYTTLAKPAWNPPGWVFGPVWTILYAMMAVAAWRVWLRGGWSGQRKALGLFLVQWALNALWTPLFFGLQQPGWALAEILVLLAAIMATLRDFWRIDRPAGLLLLPYAVWVTFASALNGAIWWMN